MEDQIFDLVFNSAGALNQVVFIIVGLVLVLIGGALVYDHRSWVHKAKRVTGTVVGLRVDDSDSDGTAIYYPVVEYVGPQGDTIRAESDSGSSSYIKKKPGMRVTVFVMPDKPEVFRFRGNLFLTGGIILSLVGTGICAAAFIFYEFTLYTLVIGAMFLLWGVVKFRKHIKPRGEWEKAARFVDCKREEFMAERAELEFLDAAALKTRQKKEDTSFKRWLWAWVLVALGTMGAGVWLANDMYETLAVGTHVPGRVIDIEADHDSDGVTYRAIVEFEDRQGRRHKLRDSVSSNPAMNEVGDEVGVVYEPDNPDEAMIDRGVWNWFLSGILFGFGFIMLLGLMMHNAEVNSRTMRR